MPPFVHWPNLNHKYGEHLTSRASQRLQKAHKAHVHRGNLIIRYMICSARVLVAWCYAWADGLAGAVHPMFQVQGSCPRELDFQPSRTPRWMAAKDKLATGIQPTLIFSPVPLRRGLALDTRRNSSRTFLQVKTRRNRNKKLGTPSEPRRRALSESTQCN